MSHIDAYSPCEVAADCLECPLSRCRHDDPEWYRQMRARGKTIIVAERAARLRSEGLRVPQIAQRLGLSVRHVQRVNQRMNRMARTESPGDLRVFARLYAQEMAR